MKRTQNSKLNFFILGFISALSILFIFSFTIFTNQTSGNPESFPQGYRIISPEIPSELSFAGEKVPLENFEVYERIDREFLVNTYWHSSTLLSLKRANRWFPVIEPILAKYNIPDDFKFLAVIESGLGNVVSPAGATGFWQLVEGSALKYDLEVNEEVDERYNVEKSTEAACKYLLDAYKQFNSWTMAAASYNFGTNGIQKQILKQKSGNYYNLVFGEETSRYIARTIATKVIFNDPQNYGFDLTENDLYHPLETKTQEVNYSISNLADFALKNGINYKILKMYNPWLRDNFLINRTKKIYSIKFPEDGSLKTISE